MRRDRQGFDYPVANPDMCVDCGKCTAVCPVMNPMSATEPMTAYAAKLPQYIGGSSSGGVFPALAKEVVDECGVVFGAVLNPDMTVGHAEADDMAGVEAMRGSKYVQSDMYDAFSDVKSYLDEGKSVLFSGTPCQVAGLNKFLGKPYENLLTVDLACHGAPSPGLWEKYVAALARKHGSRVIGVQFRDKSQSWRRYEFTVQTTERKVSVPCFKDVYMTLFLQDMSLRPSCYCCPAKGGKSHSDITLADLWNVSAVAEDMDDDRGTSLVLANTLKGKAAVSAVCEGLVEVDVVEAIKRNAGFLEGMEVPERRDEFFSGMHSTTNIIEYMSSYVVRKSIFMRYYQYLHTALSKIKRRICE